MSIRVQKVIRFIPGVNLVSVVAWIITGTKKKLGVSYFIKKFVLMFALGAFAFMLECVLSSFSDNEIFSAVLLYISLVLYTYIFAFISVSEQENIHNDRYEAKKQ